MTVRANSISRAIIEALYSEALSLAEEARAAFERSGALGDVGTAAGGFASGERIALSCEALRTTTRMMHALAWLLNHRAFFAGELSEFQLRRHGGLPGAQPVSEPAQLAMLDQPTARVVERSCAFYARIERIDQRWRGHDAEARHTVQHLRARIGQSFAG